MRGRSPSAGKGTRPRSRSPATRGKTPMKKVPVRSTNAFVADELVHYIGDDDYHDDYYSQDALAGYTDEECDEMLDYLSEHDEESRDDSQGITPAV